MSSSKLLHRLPFYLVLVVLAALAAVAIACDDDAEENTTLTPTDTPAELVERLFTAEDNNLDVYDLETDEATQLIPKDRNNVNGQACLMPDGSGNFLMGEDTNQSDGDRQGWGVFSPDGVLQQKMLEPVTEGEAEQPEPFGCAFDSQGRLFVTDVGSGNFDATDGKLVMFFPPDYDTTPCVLDAQIRVAGTIAIDAAGSVYVPETVPPGKVQRWTGPFPANADECESVQPAKTTFIEDPDVQTPFSLVAAPNGNWYLSSVFLPTTIREYDADGNFVRTIIEGDDIGNPAGLAVASDGTIYYADLGLRQETPEDLPGPAAGEGTVRKVTFDADGNALPPEIIGSGLDFPDAVSILLVE